MLFRVIRQILEAWKLNFKPRWSTGICIKKFFASLEIDRFFALSLLETFVFFQFHVNLRTVLTLPLKQFNTSTLSKNMLLTRESLRAANETL